MASGRSATHTGTEEFFSAIVDRSAHKGILPARQQNATGTRQAEAGRVAAGELSPDTEYVEITQTDALWASESIDAGENSGEFLI